MLEAHAASRGRGKRELPWFWKLEFTFNNGIFGGDEVRDAVDGWTTEGENMRLNKISI